MKPVKVPGNLQHFICPIQM